MGIKKDTIHNDETGDPSQGDMSMFVEQTVRPEDCQMHLNENGRLSRPTVSITLRLVLAIATLRRHARSIPPLHRSLVRPIRDCRAVGGRSPIATKIRSSASS